MKRTPASLRLILVRCLSALACCLVAQTWAQKPSISFHFINVGQGASTLIESDCGLVLIDAGAQDEESADNLIAYLKKVFQRRTDLQNTIELVGITHTHIDHNFALQKVVENFTVKRYLDNGRLSGSGERNAKWIRDQIHAGKPIRLKEITNAAVLAASGHQGLTDDFIDPLNCDGGDPVIRVLSGSRSDDEINAGDVHNENDHSIVWRVDFGRVALLITGDLQDHEIHRLVHDYAGTKMLDVDLYEVGHHGFKNGTTQELLDAMTPTRAIIEVGEWDYGKTSPTDEFNTYAYGHPNLGIIKLLEHGISKSREPKIVHAGRGARDFVTYTVHEAVYGTGFDGNIVMTAKQDGTLKVQTDH
jgi:beta-lactamase superfamily II metal-dependent hydrolase